jgi:hypothetical protein
MGPTNRRHELHHPHELGLVRGWIILVPMRRPLLVLTLALSLSCGGGRPASAPSAVLGKHVSLSLPSNEGALVTLPLVGSRATVVDFFAPTCEPCKAKLPALVAREADIAARGARLVLVAVLGDGEPIEVARRALSSWGVTRPFLVDDGGASRASAGVSTLPATLVLDAQGTLVWSAPATATAEDVVAAIP